MEYYGHGGIRTTPNQSAPCRIRQQDELHNLEHEKDLDNYKEGSLQTLHTGGNRAVHEQGDEKAMQ